MARRKKSTGTNLFFDLTSRLPWWLSLGIAVVAYFALHRYATSPTPPIVPGKVPDLLSEVMFKGLATGGQYIIPILFVFAAILSVVRAKSSHAEDEPLPRSPSNLSSVRATSVQSIACPECGSAMVKRSAKRGSNAGNMFWGCTNYPRCKGTRTLQ
jgi:restriction system protein